MKQVKVFAPATVANVAVGFDILGFAVEGVGDIVTASRSKTPGVTIKKIHSNYKIPLDASKNTAGFAAQSLLAEFDKTFGVDLVIHKQIPLSSGLGGSAASSVGAVVAVNKLLGSPFELDHLYSFALKGESIASGSIHGDNVGPCLYGGFTLVSPTPEIEPLALKYPSSLTAVLIHQKVEVETKYARSILRKDISMTEHNHQSYYLAAFLSHLQQGNIKNISSVCHDIIVEPQRKHLIPGFEILKSEAISAGALAFSISGSGPTTFALCANPKSALEVKKQLIKVLKHLKQTQFQIWISKIAKSGAKIIK